MSKANCTRLQKAGEVKREGRILPSCLSPRVDVTCFRASEKPGRMCVNLEIFTLALGASEGACEPMRCLHVR